MRIGAVLPSSGSAYKHVYCPEKELLLFTHAGWTWGPLQRLVGLEPSIKDLNPIGGVSGWLSPKSVRFLISGL